MCNQPIRAASIKATMCQLDRHKSGSSYDNSSTSLRWGSQAAPLPHARYPSASPSRVWGTLPTPHVALFIIFFMELGFQGFFLSPSNRNHGGHMHTIVVHSWPTSRVLATFSTLILDVGLVEFSTRTDVANAFACIQVALPLACLFLFFDLKT
jgi:hypothetical protein